MNKLHTNLTETNPFRILYTWSSPERQWSPKKREWYVYYSVLFVILIAIAAILGEFLFIMAIIAFIFLWFIQASVEPKIVEHSITTLGIKTYGKVFKWKEINHFWFTKKGSTKFLNLDLEVESGDGADQYRIHLIVNDDELVFKNLVKFIDYGDKQEIGYNFFNKISTGEHIDITKYLKDSTLTQEEFLMRESMDKNK